MELCKKEDMVQTIYIGNRKIKQLYSIRKPPETCEFYYKKINEAN